MNLQEKETSSKNIFFYVLVRARNSFEYFDKTINSILEQNYSNYRILYIDDNSNYTIKQRKYIKKKLISHCVIFNKKRKYSLQNAYHAIHKYIKNDNSVVISLDGDDWFSSKNSINELNKIYKKHNPVATYGDCFIWKNGKQSSKKASQVFEYCNTKYPSEIIKNKEYRRYPFLPLHLRTWKTSIFKKIKKEDFKNSNSQWLKFCEDQAIFYPILEMYGKKVLCVKKPLSVYNTDNQDSDVKINLIGQIRDELTIRKKPKYENFKNE